MMRDPELFIGGPLDGRWTETAEGEFLVIAPKYETQMLTVIAEMIGNPQRGPEPSRVFTYTRQTFEGRDSDNQTIPISLWAPAGMSHPDIMSHLLSRYRREA